jgi:predicted DNA-binding protein (UPF0251 family)
VTAPDRDRTKAILANWSAWSRNDPIDAAQVHYYTASPMFSAVIPQGSSAPCDNDSAMMVEEVMRMLFKKHPATRRILIEYYTRDSEEAAEALAERMGMSRATLFRRLNVARNLFAQTWGELIS